MAVSKPAVAVAAGIAASAALLAGLMAAPGNAAVTPGGGCAAVAHVDSQWGSGSHGGQILGVAVTNNSTTASTAWKVSWTLGAGQSVRSAWNTVISTSGGVTTAANTSHNGALAPGATTNFGVQLAGVGSAPTLTCDNGTTPPADYTVAEADDGGTVNMRVGQTLAVTLPASYATPASSSAALTLLSSGAGTTLFRAAEGGAADLTSGAWSVHVVVAGLGGTGSGQSWTVTEADNGRTLAMKAGDLILVSLAAAYVPPTAGPASVISPASISGGYPTGQPLRALYSTPYTGEADITSYTDIACNHDPMPCPSPPVPWKIHLVVS